MGVTVGIIGAMDLELALLKEAMDGMACTAWCGMDFCAGTLGGTGAVVVRSGVGKVNAARCAQVLIDRFGATQLINTGVAGALAAELGIGSLVVATDCVQHDMDASALGHAPGAIPDEDASTFAADARLRAALIAAARATAPAGATVLEGRVASGDQFVATATAKARIARTFGACCCEMEGAAIAQVAHAAGVPFAVIRAISDKADGTAELDYPTFADAAARTSATIVMRALRELAEAAHA